jgi:hypothetical protein
VPFSRHDHQCYKDISTAVPSVEVASIDSYFPTLLSFWHFLLKRLMQAASHIAPALTCVQETLLLQLAEQTRNPQDTNKVDSD